jgi:hypothetical protein
VRIWLALLIALTFCPMAAKAEPQAPPAGQTAPARPLGTIKSISGNSLTLSTDAGVSYSVSVGDAARILRIEPGAKDLKNASPLTLSDLQVGDRILVMGKISEDGHSVAATSVIAMKKADVASKQEHDRQDWQRRGVGGLVSAVDPATGTITITARAAAGSKDVAIHTSKDTILRRYAPDSVNFDDAKPSSLGEIKPGDQVLARGTRSADGSELAAEEIVSGAFRNIAGTISSIDAASNTINVMDLIAKKPVDVKITQDSQLRKLPPQMAQFMAMRLKGGQAGAGSGAAGNGAPAEKQAGAAGASGSGAGGSPADGGNGQGGRGGRRRRRPSADTQSGTQSQFIRSTKGRRCHDCFDGWEWVWRRHGNHPRKRRGADSSGVPQWKRAVDDSSPWSMEAPAGDAAQ